MAQKDNEKAGVEDDIISPQKSSSARRWLLRGLMIFLILVLTAALIWGGYFVYNSITGASSGSNGVEGENTNESAILNPPIFMAPLDYQVALSDGRRFLAVSVRLEVVSENTANFIAGRIPIVNDIIISTLQRKSSNDLRSAAGVMQLKVDISRRLNNGKLFNSDFISAVGSTSPIVGVYFDKFILQ